MTAMADDLQFRSAVELLRLGFGELVPMEIISIDRAKLPAESLRLLVVMLAMAGEERPAHGMARLWLRRDLWDHHPQDAAGLGDRVPESVS